MRVFISFLATLYSFSLLAQQPVADFNAPATACLNQNLYLENTSLNANQYSWDFCQGDLSNTAKATAVEYLPGGNGPLGIDVVFDGTTWFGFIVNRGTNSVLRLDFGTDLFSVPTVVDLGNVSNVISNPSDIKIVFENGNWYGFVYGSAAPAVVRIDFGNSLKNTIDSATPITATVVISDPGSSNGGFDLMYDGSNWIIVFVQNSSFVIVTRLNTITSIPSSSDFIPGVQDPFGFALGDVVLQKSQGKYYGYVVAYGNQTLQRLTFGSTMFSAPVMDDLSSILPSTSNRLYGMDAAIDNGNYYLFISSLEGSMYKINLGQDLAQAPVDGVNLGVLSMLTNTVKVRAINQDSQWFVFSSDFLTAQLFRVTFANPTSCPANLKTSNLTDPLIQYNTTGTQFITLRSYNGSVDQVSKSITINAQTSPDIDFSNSGICVNNNTDFQATNFSGNISSYSWDFGDTGSASGTSSSTNHTYTSTGTFNVSVTASASNGCQNIKEKSITIFNQPSAAFSLPAPSVSCTNQDYLFTNTTTSDVGASPTWQWSIEGGDIITTKNLTATFPTPGSKSIQLVASLPGCSSQVTHSFLVQQQGPLTDFSFSGICQNDGTQLTNQTIGSVINYSWDFGDATSSSDESPQHTYTAIGTYVVSLTAFNSAGCNNVKTKTITIYSKPQPDFSLALPPFSCSGSLSKFTDGTPSLFDSNVTSWQWNFGDPSSAQNTSNAKNPTHLFATSGTYNVTLTTSTSSNCSTTIQKSVTILPSPIAAFTNNPACVDQSTVFSDASTGDPISWTWQIGSASSIQKELTHVFTQPGNYTVTLGVKGSNGCISSVSKTISVPVAQSPDFMVYRSCVAQQTLFKDSTASSSDPIESYYWDFAGLGTATSSPATFSFTSTGSYGVKLRITAQSGCSYVVTKNVNISAAPVAAFTASPMSGIPPLNVHFTNTSTLASSYVWTFNDTPVTTTAEASPSHTFNEFGSYVVDLAARNSIGCTTTVSKIISAILPANDIAITALSTIQNADGSLNVIATLKNNSNTSLTDLVVILDLSGNTTIREKVNSTIQANQAYNHVFNFDITNASQLRFLCAEAPLDTDVDLSNNRYCITLLSNTFLYNAYPNPASDQLHVDFIANEEDHVSISIIDAMAKQSFHDEFTVHTGLNQFVIPVASLSPGIYIVTIQTSTEKKLSKIAVGR